LEDYGTTFGLGIHDRFRRVGKTHHVGDTHRTGGSQDAHCQKPTAYNHFSSASGIHPAIEMITHAKALS
jgi:hypothetical protein